MFILVLTLAGMLKCINDQAYHVNKTRMPYDFMQHYALFNASCKLGLI